MRTLCVTPLSVSPDYRRGTLALITIIGYGSVFMTSTLTRSESSTSTTRRSTLYTSVIGLAALAVLLQGLWAGLFIREGKDNNSTWVQVHARGADVAILLAVIATVVAFVKLRDRTDLVVGSVVFTVLLYARGVPRRRDR